MSGRGIASGQQVKRSMQVSSRYACPLDGGSGPTTSICTQLNRESGVGKDERGERVCRMTFDL